MKCQKFFLSLFVIIFLIFSSQLLTDDNWPTSINEIWYKSSNIPLESIFDETFLRMAYYWGYCERCGGVQNRKIPIPNDVQKEILKSFNHGHQGSETSEQQ